MEKDRESEFLKMAWEIYEESKAGKNGSDYVVNQEQMDKLVRAYRFFAAAAESSHGKVEPFHIEPADEHGGVTAYFTVFYLHGEDVKRFCRAIEGASAISIDSMEDGAICVSITIPNVYKHK